jgi:ribosomal protein S18 acetylase RimI-like enzyme
MSPVNPGTPKRQASAAMESTAEVKPRAPRARRDESRGSPEVAARDREAVTVRSATLADLPTVVELRVALLREHPEHLVYGRLRPDARERAYEVFGAQLRSANEVMLLAERDGVVVGILRCVDTPNSPLLYPDRYCYVSSVYVRPAARRAGVLKALLRQAEAWCDERGLTEMRLHNVPDGVASAAWEAQGFVVIEQVRMRAER